MSTLTFNVNAPRHTAVDGVFAKNAAFHPELTAFRRDLHRHPELGFEAVYASGRVKQALKLCGVDEVHGGIGKTGVVVLVLGCQNSAHPSTHSAIGLRADMDALPLQEHNAFGWKSSAPGLMHACGHDGHTAMLISAARYLAETRNFDGTAVLIFQPGEEGYAGAWAMMQDGLFDRFPCDKVFAQHNSPETPLGLIGVTPGPMQAAVDRIEIAVRAKGGHGARPHNCVDAVLVAAHSITAVQSTVSRNLSAFDQALMETRLAALCKSIAEGFGAEAVLTCERVYPATVNTVPEATFAADVAAALVGEAQVWRNMTPSMGGEDFSFMLKALPGADLRIGQGGQDDSFLHNSQYDFNDDILPLGAALHASLVERALPLSGAAGV